MLKKLMLLSVIGLLLLAYPNPLLAQDTDTTAFKTKVFVLLTGKVVLPDGTSKGYGGGASLMIGVQPSAYVIGWFKATEHKIMNKDTDSTTQADEGKVGVTFLFPNVWSTINMSVYANLGVGAGKLEYPNYTEEIDWSKVMGGGLCFGLTEKYKIWAGLDWESTEDVQVTSISAGLSTNF